jgi:phage shock protein PspC (stress-responsive transcriptional regulator)
MISGVAGGLGEYFGVDPVIFRVLFAVLSFFGGVGLLMYGLAWLLVPEPDVGSSALDRAIGQLRVRRVPPWLVLIGGAIVLWLGWFSWWSPGPTFPAIMLLAVLLLVLIHRLDRPDWLPGPPPAGGAGASPTGQLPQAEQAVPGSPGSLGSPGSAENPTLEWSPPASGEPTSDAAGTPLIAPLNDTRRSMQAWLAEASAAHRQRVRRRRPIKVGAAVGLAIAWAVVALTDAVNRVAFPAYLWVGLAVLTTSLVVSVLTRRLTASLLVPIAVLAALTFVLGGTRTSLSDGSGQQAWQPATADQLVDHRLFAGQATFDLTALTAPVSTARTVHLTQAAGEVRVLLPAGLNATVIADVHLGQITDGRTNDTGRHVEGMNVHSELRPPAGVSGQPITIYVKVAAGHVQVERATN